MCICSTAASSPSHESLSRQHRSCVLLHVLHVFARPAVGGDVTGVQAPALHDGNVAEAAGSYGGYGSKNARLKEMMAKDIKTLDDLDKAFPGQIDEIREW